MLQHAGKAIRILGIIRKTQNSALKFLRHCAATSSTNHGMIPGSPGLLRPIRQVVQHSNDLVGIEARPRAANIQFLPDQRLTHSCILVLHL